MVSDSVSRYNTRVWGNSNAGFKLLFIFLICLRTGEKGKLKFLVGRNSGSVMLDLLL